MLFAIQHHTYYKYSQPVVFEPHFLRFKPREDPFQKLLKFRIIIKPEPAGISEQIDLDGNTTCQIWFNGLFQELEVQSTGLIETYNTNPFNYLVYPERAINLPMEYTQDGENLLKPYTTPITNSAEILRFAEEIANEVDRQTILFLTRLTRKINQEFRKEYRRVGDPYPPEKTLSEKKGTCRDLAVLFMSVCRGVGLAARFVSGYYFDESSKNKQDLHS
jgi:transglutaminase-like putative cysteine protease